MNYLEPIISNGEDAQIDDPQIGQTSGNHQDAQALWIRQMAFVEIKPTAFLVGEKGFDLKTFFVPINGFVRQFEIGDQEDGCEVALPQRALAIRGP